MGRWRDTRLAAVSETGVVTALSVDMTDPADLRPMDYRRRDRKPDKAEYAAAEAKIRAQKAKAMLADFGPNETLADLVNTL